MTLPITLYNATTKKCNQVTLYNAADVSLLALQHRNLKCKQTNSGVPAPLRCFEAGTLFRFWTLSIERTTVIMNLDGDVDMVEFDTAEQSAEIIIALQKKTPPLECYRSFFRNEKLRPVDKYNRKSKTIEAFCSLCVSTSAVNGMNITRCDS